MSSDVREEGERLLTTPLLLEKEDLYEIDRDGNLDATATRDVNGVAIKQRLSSKEENDPNSSVFSMRSKLLLMTMFLNSFLSNSIVSLIAPFLPHHIVTNLHGSSSIVGILMSAYPLAVFFTLPICNILCRRVGRRACLFGGELLQGLAAIMFGYGEQVAQLFIAKSENTSENSHDGGLYTKIVIVVYFVARILEGFGSAAANLAITSIIADHFKSNLGCPAPLGP